MMVWDTLLIDGFDTRNLFTVVEKWDGMDGAAGVRGNNVTPSGRDGELWRRKSREAGKATIGIAVLPVSPTTGAEPATAAGRLAQFNANWAEIVRRVSVRRRPLTLERRLSLPDGVETTLTAKAELAGGVPQARINADHARAVLPFTLLDGCWFGESATYQVDPGESAYLPAQGTTDTSNMRITLTGGTGTQTLRNVSAGVWLSYLWTGYEGSTVVIDVPNFTVFRYQGAFKFTSLFRLSHGGDARFMLVDPDLSDNEFTVNQGQAIIEYRGAYL